MRCRSCGCRVKGHSTVCPRCLELSKIEYKCKLESYIGGESLYKAFKIVAWASRVLLLLTIVFCLVYLLNFREMYHYSCLFWVGLIGLVVSAGGYFVRDYLESCVDYNVKR